MLELQKRTKEPQTKSVLTLGKGESIISNLPAVQKTKPTSQRTQYKNCLKQGRLKICRVFFDTHHGKSRAFSMNHSSSLFKCLKLSLLFSDIKFQRIQNELHPSRGAAYHKNRPSRQDSGILIARSFFNDIFRKFSKFYLRLLRLFEILGFLRFQCF